MSARGRLHWLRAVLAVGIAYLVIGLIVATLAKSAGSAQTRTAWRLSAWAISATAFAMHIAYEHGRLHRSPRTTAWHTSLGVGLGACALAIAARFHAQAATPQQHFSVSAIAIWPVLVALPAFVVALAFAWVVDRGRRSA